MKLYQEYSMSTNGVVSSPSGNSFIDEPRAITAIDTDREYTILYGVVCLNNTEVWTRGGNNMKMNLYNLRGELVKSIRTKSGNEPRDIAVTRSGDLVYTDRDDRTVNIVKKHRYRQ